ncbi:hypothetical protein ACWKWU_15375 [Chitinophaga lutea]
MRLNKVLWLLPLLFASCGNAYKGLQRTAGDGACIAPFRPAFDSTVLYNTQVDVLNHHFSGLLLFKPMDDGSMRVVFLTETGVKFFDFGFGKDGSFTRYYVLPKMDRKAVVKTLRKDLGMVLMRQDPATARTSMRGAERYTTFPLTKGSVHYVTDSACSQLLRVENGSARSVVAEAFLTGYHDGIPDSILVRHKKFTFNISSQRVHK